MGQLNHLPRTNVLAFPRARAEESNSSQLQESYGRGHREGAAKRSARLAPQPHGIDDGYLLVPLSGDDKRAILDLLKRPHIVSSSALRFLITAFVLLAVLPSLSLTANLWLDRTDTAPSPAVRVSSNHGSEAIITLPAISIPTTLKAIIGENTPFPIAIGGTDPGEGAGMIVISRLPQDSMFSAGNPDGETTWKLAPGEIDNLHLVLPKTAREDTALLLQLLAPDGHVISDAATIIEVADVSEASVSVRRVRTQVVPGHIWDQPSREPEAVDAEAEHITQKRASQPDAVSLPTRHPRW